MEIGGDLQIAADCGGLGYPDLENENEMKPPILCKVDQRVLLSRLGSETLVASISNIRYRPSGSGRILGLRSQGLLYGAQCVLHVDGPRPLRGDWLPLWHRIWFDLSAAFDRRHDERQRVR